MTAYFYHLYACQELRLSFLAKAAAANEAHPLDVGSEFACECIVGHGDERGLDAGRRALGANVGHAQ
jgi:hypothetical protein